MNTYAFTRDLLQVVVHGIYYSQQFRIPKHKAYPLNNSLLLCIPF